MDNANSKTPDIVRLASAATVKPFFFADVFSTSRMCAGVMLLIGSDPIFGNTTRVSMSSRRFLVISSQSFKASHSFATASKVVALSCFRLMRSSCRLWAGLIPCLTSDRALMRSSRASARVNRRPARLACPSSGVSPLGAMA